MQVKIWYFNTYIEILVQLPHNSVYHITYINLFDLHLQQKQESCLLRSISVQEVVDGGKLMGLEILALDFREVSWRCIHAFGEQLKDGLPIHNSLILAALTVILSSLKIPTNICGVIAELNTKLYFKLWVTHIAYN